METALAYTQTLSFVHFRRRVLLVCMDVNAETMLLVFLPSVVGVALFC